MGLFTIKLPDVGEGIAEAELTEWAVSVGDLVAEDDVLGTVMTDKAAVEIPSTIAGKVTWLCGEPGDQIAIGAKFVQLEVDGDGNTDEEPAMASVEPPAKTGDIAENAEPDPEPEPTPAIETPAPPYTPHRPLAKGEKPLAAPSVRQRAREAGVDLRRVPGSGPAGRISHADLDAFISRGDKLDQAGPGRTARHGETQVKVIGMRRKIAEKMALSKARIPHITIVEEVDVTALEDLRAGLNTAHATERGKLTMLPFIMRAIATAVEKQPEMNARYDDEAGIIHQSAGVHIGIASQTDIGLMVPVIWNAEALSLWESAREVARQSEAARSGKAKREDLSGSTITITSLGSLGAIATTPIINHPEVAIVGINKMAMRPVWDGQDFQPRKMMNISCSFDHRVIDGWDAAVFVQKLKSLLETPAMLFIED